VLAFRYFLIDPDALPQFTAQLSKTMAACCLGALRAKVEKDKYDLLLLDLMQTSLKNETAATTGPMAEIERFPKRFANRGETAALFLLDLCTLVTFDDRETDPAEQRFLATVCTALQLPGAKTEEAVQHIKAFARSNATRIKLFENANPVKYFYKQANKTVQVLIVRNSSRLLKELNESGELLLLLGQSTLRDLNREERKKVKEQLLDICRAIPSLTIFLLPGGTLLLPLLVKFIPKLLPSAFHENRIDKN
ncbi:MAG: LETM1-related biofilm-associated protein, partial [Marinirhabdus sp.]